MAYKKKTSPAPAEPDRIQYIVTDQFEATINNRSIKAKRGDRIMLDASEAKVLARFVLL